MTQKGRRPRARRWNGQTRWPCRLWERIRIKPLRRIHKQRAQLRRHEERAPREGGQRLSWSLPDPAGGGLLILRGVDGSESFPLDCARRLAGHVIDDAVDSADLADDA